MKNNGYVYRDRIKPENEQSNVLDFYCKHYSRFNRETWAKRIRNGLIFKNRKQVNADDILFAGDMLAYHRLPWIEPEVPTKFDILFEDAHLLVANKPVGLPVLPGDVYLENTLLALVRKRFSPELSPIHRLDRPTSGTVIFAKTSEARRGLGVAIQNGNIRKTYLALATGNSMADSFTVTVPIGSVPHPVSGAVATALRGGRPSETRFRVVKRCGRTALLMAFLKTGRPHQIRIHLAYAGYPLDGEQFYEIGGKPCPEAVQPGEGDFLLHAWRLRFFHPITGKRLRVTAPSPSEKWAF